MFRCQSLLCISGLIFVAACESKNAPAYPTSSEGSVEQGEAFAASSGRWRIVDVDPTPKTLIASRDIESLREDSVQPASSFIVDRGEALAPSEVQAPSMFIQPVIETPADLIAYLGGAKGVDYFKLPPGNIPLQVIDGVPDGERYKDPKFDRIREGFSRECRESAKRYTKVAIDAMKALSEEDAIESINAIRLEGERGDAYDKECLKQIGQIPDAVAAVSGVLVAAISTNRGQVLFPFCSGTAIGPTEILTARHCFFDPRSGAKFDKFIDPDTGYELNTFALLQRPAIRFVPIGAPDSGGFSVILKDGENQGENPFGPNEDQLRLHVLIGSLRKFAKVETTALTESDVPKTAWIAGSNGTLFDLSVLRHSGALAFVRGSGPDSCAVIEVTTTGCYYHTCQTGAQTSGAGLLVLEGNGKDVRLIGVHTGAAAKGNDCAGGAPLGTRLNLAAKVNR